MKQHEERAANNAAPPHKMPSVPEAVKAVMQKFGGIAASARAALGSNSTSAASRLKSHGIQGNFANPAVPVNYRGRMKAGSCVLGK